MPVNSSIQENQWCKASLGYITRLCLKKITSQERLWEKARHFFWQDIKKFLMMANFGERTEEGLTQEHSIFTEFSVMYLLKNLQCACIILMFLTEK
jgi:hypothetical protein